MTWVRAWTGTNPLAVMLINLDDVRSITHDGHAFWITFRDGNAISRIEVEVVSSLPTAFLMLARNREVE